MSHEMTPSADTSKLQFDIFHNMIHFLDVLSWWLFSSNVDDNNGVRVCSRYVLLASQVKVAFLQCVLNIKSVLVIIYSYILFHPECQDTDAFSKWILAIVQNYEMIKRNDMEESQRSSITGQLV